MSKTIDFVRNLPLPDFNNIQPLVVEVSEERLLPWQQFVILQPGGLLWYIELNSRLHEYTVSYLRKRVKEITQPLYNMLSGPITVLLQNANEPEHARDCYGELPVGFRHGFELDTDKFDKAAVHKIERSTTCSMCAHGLLKEESSQSTVLCPACKGTGNGYKEKCKWCKGRGKIKQAGLYEPVWSKALQHRLCYSCGGWGKHVHGPLFASNFIRDRNYNMETNGIPMVRSKDLPKLLDTEAFTLVGMDAVYHLEDIGATSKAVNINYVKNLLFFWTEAGVTLIGMQYTCSLIEQGLRLDAKRYTRKKTVTTEGQ